VAKAKRSAVRRSSRRGRRLQGWIAETQGENGTLARRGGQRSLRKKGRKDEKSQREWLKIQHKSGTNSALSIAARAAGKESEEDSPEKYLAAGRVVEKQYSAKKEVLRRFTMSCELGKSVGSDVKACPCLTMVPLYRNHVLRRSSRRQIRVWILVWRSRHYRENCRNDWLIRAGSQKKDRITHRIENYGP